MRWKILTALLGVVLLLAACESSTTIDADGSGPGTAKVHWQQNVAGSRERVVRVYVDGPRANAALRQAVNVAVTQADRSPYLNYSAHVVSVLPTACAAPVHCITVTSRSGVNGAVAATGWGSDGHMFGLATRVTFDSAPWNQAVLNNAACHEIAGHGAGLAHGTSQGPCVDAVLTSTDLSNIATTHNHNDPLWASATATQKSPKLDHVRKTSRAEFTEMAAR